METAMVENGKHTMRIFKNPANTNTDPAVLNPSGIAIDLFELRFRLLSTGSISSSATSSLLLSEEANRLGTYIMSQGWVKWFYDLMKHSIKYNVLPCSGLVTLIESSVVEAFCCTTAPY